MLSGRAEDPRMPLQDVQTWSPRGGHYSRRDLVSGDTAWFDVCTSARGLPQLIAVLQAALLEIPLSCAALWFAAVTIRCAAQAGSSAGTTAGA